MWAVPRHCDRQGRAERCPLERLVENDYMERRESAHSRQKAKAWHVWEDLGGLIGLHCWDV